MTFLLGMWRQKRNRNAATPPRGAHRTRPRRMVPALELLEDRTVPSTLTVTTPADDGSAPQIYRGGHGTFAARFVAHRPCSWPC